MFNVRYSPRSFRGGQYGTGLHHRHFCPNRVPLFAILLLRHGYVRRKTVTRADEGGHRGWPSVCTRTRLVSYACLQLCLHRVSALRVRLRLYLCLRDRTGYHGQRAQRLAQNIIRAAAGRRLRDGRMVHATPADLGAFICFLPRFGHKLICSSGM